MSIPDIQAAISSVVDAFERLGVLQVQGPNLDDEYLRRWAERLGLLDLLEKAMDESLP